MRKLVSFTVVLVLAISVFAIYAHAGAVKKAVTQVINTIKTRGQTSTPTPTTSTAVRG
jgi:hypothetical protein